jgi:undecaprenyl-diphosphatase
MESQIQALVLAAVQGLTEFLPVSSSGHLVLLQHLFGAHSGDLLFDVVLHGGTLGSVVVVYWRDLMRLLRLDAAARGYVLALAVGTVPAVLVGGLLGELVGRLFQSPLVAGGGLVVTAAMLFSTRRVRTAPMGGGEPWSPRVVPWRRALLVGCAQALAICPGISRSGATIASGLWLGLPRDEAARFAFLLSVPAIAGALLLQFLSGDLTTRTGAIGLVLSALIAFAVGLLAVRWTALAVIQRHFWKFGFYCLGLGVIVLATVG